MVEVQKTLNDVKEYIVPQSAFSKGDSSVPIRVIYISDLHLDAHLVNLKINLEDKKSVIKYVDNVIKGLLDGCSRLIMSDGVTPDNEKDLLNGYYYLFKKNHSDLSDVDLGQLEDCLINDEKNNWVKPCLEPCVCFLGDISADEKLIELFFDRLVLRLKYYEFKKWKKGAISQFNDGRQSSEEKYNAYLENINNKILNYLLRIKKVEIQTGKKNLLNYYGKKNDYDITRLITGNKLLPNYLSNLIIAHKELTSKRDYLIREKDTLCKISLSENVKGFFCDEPTHCPFFYILGNHELSAYDTIEDAVEVYRKMLSRYGLQLLHNEIVSYGNCYLIGGTGFAKNNELYNAETIIGPEILKGNRKLEAKETDKFLEKYMEVLDSARHECVPVVVLAHYPVTDWLNQQTDSRCYYFHGHNHQNAITVNETCHIYGDNQIGYVDDDIFFKSILLGTSYNPFIDYEDGYYEITASQYQDFYNYSGEFIKTRLIQSYIEKGQKLYLIKRNSFYGFFILGDKNAKICYGGSAKKISDITDINYYYDAFSLMIFIYLQVMLPLRKTQEKISSEIKKIGAAFFLSGKIHGTIIDVDYYHHIMLNPFDGTVTLYYSPIFGIVKKFDTFEELMLSVCDMKELTSCEKEVLFSNIDLLPKGSLISKTTDEIQKIVHHDMEEIDIKNSMYSISSKINQLQRLFTSNILRDWNNDLISRYINPEKMGLYHIKEKKLSSYDMIQKHWKNLLLIPSSEINEKLVKCALNPYRKCHFPYQETKRQYGWDRPDNPMGDSEIRDYINHIPTKVLKKSFLLFYQLLGCRVLEYYPIEILEYADFITVMSDAEVGNKEKIKALANIPFEDWTEDLSKAVKDGIKLKNRPTYCPADLWKHMMGKMK